MKTPDQSQCICTKYAKRETTTVYHPWGKYTNRGMAYFNDKECTDFAYRIPTRRIRKTRGQFIGGVPVWCIVVPGELKREVTE